MSGSCLAWAQSCRQLRTLRTFRQICHKQKAARRAPDASRGRSLAERACLLAVARTRRPGAIEPSRVRRRRRAGDAARRGNPRAFPLPEGEGQGEGKRRFIIPMGVAYPRDS